MLASCGLGCPSPAAGGDESLEIAETISRAPTGMARWSARYRRGSRGRLRLAPWPHRAQAGIGPASCLAAARLAWPLAGPGTHEIFEITSTGLRLHLGTKGRLSIRQRDDGSCPIPRWRAGPVAAALALGWRGRALRCDGRPARLPGVSPSQIANACVDGYMGRCGIVSTVAQAKPVLALALAFCRAPAMRQAGGATAVRQCGCSPCLEPS
jgi:hypothetical protein